MLLGLVSTDFIATYFVRHITGISDFDFLWLSLELELSPGKFPGPAGANLIPALVAVALLQEVVAILSVESAYSDAVFGRECIAPALFEPWISCSSACLSTRAAGPTATVPGADVVARGFRQATMAKVGRKTSLAPVRTAPPVYSASGNTQAFTIFP